MMNTYSAIYPTGLSHRGGNVDEFRGPHENESTATLLVQVQRGDGQARERLIARYLPILDRWASGRLPARARSLHDTGDLVQETLIKALERLDRFEYRREGAFLAYLRTCLLNKVRDLADRAEARRVKVSLSPTLRDRNASPLENAIGTECIESYERALSRLPANRREAIILRVEMGLTYAEVAEAIGGTTPGAVRMLVSRGIVELIEVMNHDHDKSGQ